MKKCYRCGKEMGFDEIVSGISKLNDSGHAEQIEDFVHCMGEENEFIQKYDIELINYLKKKLGEENEYEGSVIACEECVSKCCEE